MKNNLKKIIIVAPLLIVAGFSGYFLCSDVQQKNINKDFSFDVVRSLNEVYTSRGLAKEPEESTPFETAYFMKEHVSNAKDIMEKWTSDKDELRKNVTTLMIDGIDNILIASDVFIDIIKNVGNSDENYGLFVVKLDKGREDLWFGASRMVSEDDGIKLSKSQKQEVINYIESVFEDELEVYKEYEENQEKDENFIHLQEV